MQYVTESKRKSIQNYDYEILVMKYYRIKTPIGSQSLTVQEKTYLEEDHPFQIEVIAKVVHSKYS